METKLVTLKPNDRVKLRKEWRKYAQNQQEIDIVSSWLWEDKHYRILCIDDNIDTPIVKLYCINSRSMVPFYYTRAMFRKIALPHLNNNQL